MMNRQKVEGYFKDLEAILTERNLLDKPKLVWNMDETGKSFEQFLLVLELKTHETSVRLILTPEVDQYHTV
jgi:hypothetical protein